MGKHGAWAADRVSPGADVQCGGLGASCCPFSGEVHGPSPAAVVIRIMGRARPLLFLRSRNILAFGDELERAAEDSEAGLATLGAVVQELMAQSVSALATGHLQGLGTVVLRALDHAVWVHRLSEGGPWRRMHVLGAAREELIATLGTHICA